MEARRAHNPEVVGSSPASATIKIPGIHYEYRDFSNFWVLLEMAQLAVLGHFWVTWVKNLFSWVTPSGFRAEFFMLFFGEERQRYTRKPWLCSPQ